MIESLDNDTNLSIPHMAGIIPAVGTRRFFSFSWPDCFMPVSRDTTAIEKAVMAAAYAGCKTIWVICDRSLQKYLRRRLGEYVIDPSNYHLQNIRNQRITKIPIFYVAVHQKYVHYYNDTFFTLYGIYTAYKKASTISRWTCPSHFFISFPFGIADTDDIQKFRLKYAKLDKMLMLTRDGKGIKEGLSAPFTISYEQWKLCHKRFLELPKPKRRICNPIDVFSVLEEEKYDRYEIDEFYEINHWSVYVKYLNSRIPENTWRHRILTNKRWYRLRHMARRQKTIVESFDNESETPCEPPQNSYSESNEEERDE